MRPGAKLVSHGERSGILPFLRRASSKFMDVPFLTLLIAVGTLATAGVAYRTAVDSHEQVQLLKRQVEFNATETRPFLRLKSSISAGHSTIVTLHVINLGRIPARVVAYDMAVQLGRKVIEPKGGTFNTQDVLFPDQPGLGVFQPLEQADARLFQKGVEPIVVGGCVIYASITAADPRLWRAAAAYQYHSSSDTPIGLFAYEADAAPGTLRCDASSLRGEWQSQLKLYPR